MPAGTRSDSLQNSDVPRRACDDSPLDVDTDHAATPRAAPAHFFDLAAPDRTGSGENPTTGQLDAEGAAEHARTHCRPRARSSRPGARVAPAGRTTRADSACGVGRPT